MTACPLGVEGASALLAAGTLTPEELGVTTREGILPAGTLVAGERIKVHDLRRCMRGSHTLAVSSNRPKPLCDGCAVHVASLRLRTERVGRKNVLGSPHHCGCEVV